MRFGDCLVNSLYGVYQKAEPGFVEKYFALLSAGGSKHYSELLAPFGLDARDPAFWDIGLSMIEGLIDELEQIGVLTAAKCPAEACPGFSGGGRWSCEERRL